MRREYSNENAMRQCGALRCNVVQCGAMRCNVVQCGADPHDHLLDDVHALLADARDELLHQRNLRIKTQSCCVYEEGEGGGGVCAAESMPSTSPWGADLARPQEHAGLELEDQEPRIVRAAADVRTAARQVAHKRVALLVQLRQRQLRRRIKAVRLGPDRNKTQQPRNILQAPA